MTTICVAAWRTGRTSRAQRPTNVDDVVAEVMAIAWRRLDDVRRTTRSLGLYRTAHNTVTNIQRAGRRRLRLVERLGAEPPAVHASENVDLARALTSLRPTIGRSCA